MKFFAVCLASALALTSSFTTLPAPATQSRLYSEVAEKETMDAPASTIVAAKGGAIQSFDDLKSFANEANPIVKYFDPMNLADFEGGFWEEGQEATIGFLRHAEIKHGRVAMAAFVGYLVHAQGWTWPFPMQMDGAGWPKLDSVGSVPALWDALPQASKWQIILAIGALEVWDEYQFEGIPESKEPHYMRGGQPGKFASKKGSIFPLNLYDPFGFNGRMSDEKKQRRLVMEVNNGRLAMIGIFGFLAEGAVPGSVPLLKGLIPGYSGNVMIPFEGDFKWFPGNMIADAADAVSTASY
ncbi:hypothetical protein TL16_g01822 [Triparma laevis f. inornata]|uniref:Chlorophyll a-b binding protein, chloroplastic n=2 Tax=Triparma laevis TaxID=1534972 RepID=A0A9W7EAI3_9STRA|nr:hypothetical protein TL16_g01822 [Triparma laevis f. inornata]GMH71867.1 hypothetical protein TrLO_g12887 [Triparma laevis f. longispina]